MSSEQQILNLIGKYTHYLDQADFEKVGELFMNGKIISPGSSMEGKEGVASQLKKISRCTRIARFGRHTSPPILSWTFRRRKMKPPLYRT